MIEIATANEVRPSSQFAGISPFFGLIGNLLMKETTLSILLVEDSETDVELEERELQRAGLRFSSARIETPEDLRAALDGCKAVIKDISKSVGVDRELALMALGWLAREEKVKFETKGKDVVVSLTDGELKHIRS